MKLIRTLYILQYRQSKREILYKIGITGKTANERCEEIKATLKNKDVSVFWEGKFFLAYNMEQFLHAYFRHKNARMDKNVSGYTEFFNIGILTVYGLICVLNTLMFVRFCVFVYIVTLLLNYLAQ